MDLKFEWTKIILAFEVGYFATEFQKVFDFQAALCFFYLYMVFLIILHA